MKKILALTLVLATIFAFTLTAVAGHACNYVAGICDSCGNIIVITLPEKDSLPKFILDELKFSQLKNYANANVVITRDGEPLPNGSYNINKNGIFIKAPAGEGLYVVTNTVAGLTYTFRVGEEETGHVCVYTAVTLDPTCTEGGYTTYTCPVCGDSYDDDFTEALGHSYVGETLDPTCTEGGYTTYTCSVCGDSYDDDFTEALGHSYVGETIDPTCTEGGYTTYTCSVCGDSYDDDFTEALGHDYINGVCSRCGDIILVVLPGDGSLPPDILNALRFAELGNAASFNISVTLNGAPMANGSFNINSFGVFIKPPVAAGTYVVTNTLVGLSYTFIIA